MMSVEAVRTRSRIFRSLVGLFPTIPGLQPHDKAAMLVFNTIQVGFFLQNLHENKV